MPDQQNESSAASVRYEGEFKLAWLRDGERVMSAGDGTGAAVIVSADGSERRVNIGDEIELGEGATGAKPAGGEPCSNRDLGPSVSTDASSAATKQQIRTMHRAGYRNGQWADLLTVAPAPYKLDCYVVRFPEDGATDYWVVNDPDGQYEFREVAA